MTDRIPLDHLTSDQLDALYERAEQAEADIERALALASRWAVLRAHGSAATELRATLGEQPGAAGTDARSAIPPTAQEGQPAPHRPPKSLSARAGWGAPKQG